MDPPDTTPPLFGGTGDLAGAAAAVDLDEIFEDCFAANEWALLNDTLAAEALEPGPPVQGAPGQLPPGASPLNLSRSPPAPGRAPPAPAPAPAAVPSTGYPSVANSANGGRTHFGSDDFASMDPVEALENKTRMQKFQNVASFGSDDFFDRHTEQPDGIDYGDLRDKVADKVSLGIAMGGNILSSGMDKLREYRANR